MRWLFPLLLLPMAALGQAPASAPGTPSFKTVDSIEARMQGCVTCHGPNGEGTRDGYFPRIAGKPASYLFNQMVAFRDGTRRYPPMNYLVAYLPDAYLREIAEYFARQRPAFAARADSKPPDQALVVRGATLVGVGDASKNIPACVACHGGTLTGMEPGIPGLVGLRANYIVAQLTRWRVGERTAAEPDCMKRIASRMAETDVAAVAAYLSMQEPPADLSPQRRNLDRMPFACGSQR